MNNLKKPLIYLITVIFLSLTSGNVLARIKVGSYIGNWSPNLRYLSGDIVTHGNNNYLNLMTLNKNQIPDSAPDTWLLLGNIKPIKGDIGPSGVQGSRGLTGAQGPMGLKGDKGDIGPSGVQGSRGLTGEQGPMGLKGDKGEKGDIGPKGLTGSRGPIGLSWVESFTYKVGDKGPGGGYIFFVDYEERFVDFDYLEAAPVDAAKEIVWCDNTFNSISAVKGWSAKAVGKGYQNTVEILKVCNSGAAKIATDYESNGIKDWFLPSLGEMKIMYDNLLTAGVGDFTDGYYWTSTEVKDEAQYAWFQSFNDGTQGNYINKNETLAVRPVRAFK